MPYKFNPFTAKLDYYESGGGSAVNIIHVANYSALPDPTTVSLNDIYVCDDSQGTQWLPGSWGGTYYPEGDYYSNGVKWVYGKNPYQATQGAVNAGVVTDQFVTPNTLANVSKLGGVAVKNILRSLSSGVISGGIVTINVDPTKIDISAGTGLIIDNWTDLANPTVHEVTWTTFTAVTVTNLLTSTTSHIGIDKNGNIVQTPLAETNTQRRDVIMLAQLGHANLTNVASVNSNYSVIQSPIEQFRDLVDELKLINKGNLITANGANLSINKSSGTLFGDGINYSVDPKNPHKKTIAAQTLVNLRRRTQTGGNTGVVTTIDPTNYDLAGTITAIGGGVNQSTNQRVYLFPNGNVVVQYGQTIYTSLQLAIQGIQTETFVQFVNVEQEAILIAIISITRTCTSLQDTVNSRIFYPSIFGETIGSTGGTSVSNFQQVYDNSVEPEILTNSTLGAVSFRRGSGADTDNVLEILNGAGAITATIKGNGTITGSNLANTNTGDQTITLTGDVTGSGTDSFAATIAANAVTLAKMATVATRRLLGRITAGIGNVEALNIDQMWTLLTNTTDNTSGAIINDVSTNELNSLRFTNAPTVNGFANGANGKVLIILNDNASNALLLTHQNVGSVAANRIVTGGQTVSIPPLSMGVLRYNSTSSRWYVEGIFGNTYFSSLAGTNNVVPFIDSTGVMSRGSNIVTLFQFVQNPLGSPITAASLTSILTGVLFGTTLLNASTDTINPMIVAGKGNRVVVSGVFSSLASATFQIEVRVGSIVLLNTGALTMIANTTEGFKMEVDFDTITSGVSGTMQACLEFRINGQNPIIRSGVPVVTDTTISRVFDIRVAYGATNAMNTITIRQAKGINDAN